MPSSLKRYQNTGQSHFITFTCYHRRPLMTTPSSRRIIESALERIRYNFHLRVYGYVVMPDHVHLLLSEPQYGTLADALKSLKQGVSRRLIGNAEHFWQKRYYDFNVRNYAQFVEAPLHPSQPRSRRIVRPPRGLGMEHLPPLRHRL